NNTDIKMNGIHASVTLPIVNGLLSLSAASLEAPPISATASAACGSLASSCTEGTGAGGCSVMAAWGARAVMACGSAGPLNDGSVGVVKCHSSFGFQNCKKIAVTTSEKMPPPMSVIGNRTTPGK